MNKYILPSYLTTFLITFIVVLWLPTPKWLVNLIENNPVECGFTLVALFLIFMIWTLTLNGEKNYDD